MKEWYKIETTLDLVTYYLNKLSKGKIPNEDIKIIACGGSLSTTVIIYYHSISPFY